ncbi:MAG TPA: hypothetical protein DCQ98_11755 [Planctomycetaceae bacterium]|nr:hypothetical protein [Planctomycetaceae bacterium]
MALHRLGDRLVEGYNRGFRRHDVPSSPPMIASSEPFALSTPIVIGPLIAASLFSLGAAALKRSGRWRIGVWRTTFLCNVFIGAVYLPGILVGDRPIPWHAWWQPPVVGLMYLVGQTCTVLALTRGDISVAGPMLALKILVVALMATFLFGSPLPAWVWVSVVMATVGVALLNWGGRPDDRRRAIRTAIVAGIAAIAFASFDAGLQEWAGEWGSLRFLGIMFAVTALMSLSFVPGFGGRFRDVPKEAWPTVALGVLLLASQSMVFGSTIALFGHATEANVVYSIRGLFSVIVMIVLGRWVGSEESKLGSFVLATRSIGAILMLVSIALLLF